jgi:hypothetical protein
MKVSENLVPNPQSDTQPDTPLGVAPFKLVFFSVLGLTLVCIILAFWLTLHQQTEAIKSLSEKLQGVFTLGCGAIIGLLGGRNLR